MKRSRGRGRRPQNNQSHSYNNNPNRTFDSAGPEIKIRGSAANVYEKYQQLARDASAAGDRVMAENYLQHAEHYYRIMSAAQSAQAAQAAQVAQQQQNQPVPAAPVQQSAVPSSNNPNHAIAAQPETPVVQSNAPSQAPAPVPPSPPVKAPTSNGSAASGKPKATPAEGKPAGRTRGNGRGKSAQAVSDKNGTSAPSFSLSDSTDDGAKNGNV